MIACPTPIVQAGSVPRHGVPDDRSAPLPALLAEARRRAGAGHTRAQILSWLLQANRNLPKPMPVYSAGGLVETLDAALAGVA